MTAPPTSTFTSSPMPMPRSPEMPPPPPRSSTHFHDAPSPQTVAAQRRCLPQLSEYRDHRCACAGFGRAEELSGTACDFQFGRLARFCSTPTNTPPPVEDQDNAELLKRRLNVLEQQVRGACEQGDFSQVASRLRQLEDRGERNREELQNETKALCQNVSLAWLFIEDLQRRMTAADEAHEKQSKELASLKNSNLELKEMNEMLEERIEKLEGMDEILSLALEPPLSVQD